MIDEKRIIHSIDRQVMCHTWEHSTPISFDLVSVIDIDCVTEKIRKTKKKKRQRHSLLVHIFFFM